MRNIWKIFTTDILRISNNVVAVVIIMGLSILPALYAWFNIFSNWDPYEPAATSQLKVAVASDDAGAEIMGLSLNVGDSVLEALGANTTIGWVFPGTTEEALEGVKNSDYYAALIIPENFTQEMLGFLDGEVDHPTIYYYENEKKNGIAPKITGKAKNAVQEQVNATFVSTVAEAVMKAGNALSMANASGQASVTGSLDSVKAQLQDYVDNAAVLPEYYEFCGDDHGHQPEYASRYGQYTGERTKYHDRYADHDQFQRRCSGCYGGYGEQQYGYGDGSVAISVCVLGWVAGSDGQ